MATPGPHLEDILRQLEDSIADHRLSPEERQTLARLLREVAPPEEGLRRLRNAAFDLVRNRLTSSGLTARAMTPPAGSPPGHSPTRTGSPRGPGRKPIPRGDQTCGGSGPAESPPAPSSDRGGDVGGRGWEPIPTSGRGLGGPGPADPFSLFQWLEGVVRCLDNARLPAHPPVQSAAWFSPGEACRQAVIRRLGEARRTADICVFTISDDPVSAAVLAAHRRGVALRVITDDTKVGDRGSDIGAMQAAGIPVVIDDPEAHMHHKFALFDGLWLITGSYNWTRQAALTNDENLVETNDPALLREFAGTFERLWARYGPPPSPARTPG